MYNNDSEIWIAVKKLKGKTLYTYVENEENKIQKVEDTGSPKDGIIIKNRETLPIREDIISAYRLLFQQGYLKRNPDLDWLAVPEKKTSSIVFRIIGELAISEIDIQGSRNIKLLVKNL